ncbi:MAG TPA: RNA polymerase sigma factor [Phenylobacterium sp.]|jgi:RNA polymerase sigma-70 factor (ECF subfamily)|nr:RNA polymerase sigma factor [Phenylobacterium sp.]
MSAPESPARFVLDVADDPRVEVEGFYRTHGNWLIAFLRHRFGSQDAEELAQETYVRAIGAGAAVRNPRAYLARIAVNAARDQVRRRGARPVLVSDVARAEAAPTAPDQAEALLLKQILRAMPRDVREVFLLSRSTGLTNVDIARRCGISVKRVEARMTQALAMCKALTE